MYADTRSHYRAQAAETAGPAQLVLMLYDGALAGLTRARQVDGPEAVNRELTRVQDIVTELLVTLDRERGGPVAANLAALYDFCLDRLVEANMRKDLELLDAVQSTLADLRDAWEQACCRIPVAGPVAG
jgi:flagellar secretion chaperone FliS